MAPKLHPSYGDDSIWSYGDDSHLPGGERGVGCSATPSSREIPEVLRTSCSMKAVISGLSLEEEVLAAFCTHPVSRVHDVVIAPRVLAWRLWCHCPRCWGRTLRLCRNRFIRRSILSLEPYVPVLSWLMKLASDQLVIPTMVANVNQFFSSLCFSQQPDIQILAHAIANLHSIKALPADFCIPSCS